MAVKITIAGEGLSFEKETDMLKAGQIITFLSNDALVQQAPSSYYSPTPGKLLGVGETSRRSPRQALMESDAKTNTEKIVVLAHFICERNGAPSFSPKEIQVEFKKAGESLPKNFTRDFNQAIVAGYVLEDDEQGAGTYVLTDLGLDVLESGFSNNRQSTSLSGSKRRKGTKGKKVTTVRDEVANLQIVPQLDGYPDYWSLPTKGAKILWFLAYAEENNVPEGLTPVEVEFMASKIKDQIKTGHFTALTNNNIKKGLMTSTKGFSKILKLGEDSLKTQQV